MLNVPSANAFVAATAPLIHSFGDQLTLERDGNVVQWSYAGQTIVIELQFDGTVGATFIDAPVTDAVSGELTSAVYRRQGEQAYRLTVAGSRTMVGDMMAFFSGDREPLFAFADVRSPLA